MNQKSYFNLILPRRAKSGDKIQIIAKLKDKPKIFRILLGVKSTQDKRSAYEPTMIAFEFKVKFLNEEIKVTCNWKTDENWQEEITIDDDTDWIDTKGLINITIHFDNSQINVFDNTNSLITKFDLNYEISRINRVQLYGDILKLKSISLKYDRKN